MRFFEQFRWSVSYCRDPDLALRMRSSKTNNVYFGREIESTFKCEPDLLVRDGMTAGETWSLDC